MQIGGKMEELTFCMIKPDSVRKKNVGAILSHLEKENFKIIKAQKMQLDAPFCEIFYQEHREREFFNSLVNFIISDSIFALVLKRKDACLYLREIMGATDPKQAKPSTIRALFGESVEKNAIHGSDSLISARREMALFFPEGLS